ncbi:MAG: RES domain-containing protein [Ignavibacteriaceae bacterium]|jgi:hypothetical protein
MKETDLTSLKNYISKIDLESETAYEELFCGFTQGFNMPIIFVPLKKESFCFRSRNNQNGKDYLNFSDLLYPDKSFILNYSRANKPCQQVFYCSDNFGTTLTELLPYWSKDLKIGDSFAITISQWAFKREIYVACIPDFSNVRLMKILENKIDFKEDATLLKYWDYINSFFRAQGFNQPSIYKFTSAFCNALMRNSQIMGEEINGILYTSVQDITTQGWNLAILPEFADENLEIKSVFKIHLRKQGLDKGKPVYDNYLNPEPVFCKNLDYTLNKIIW